MRIAHSRSGVTLIEMIVALLLLLVVFAIGSLTAQRSISTAVEMGARESRAASVSDALRTLARHGVNADPRENDIRSAADSVLEIMHTIGVSTVCRVRGDTLVLSQPADEMPWSAVLPRAVTEDDQLRIWNELPQLWVSRGIRDVAAASGSCGDSSTTWSGSASQRVVMDDSIPGVTAGSPVRVVQRERWSLVRGGDGLWSLSLATWDAVRGAYATPQPVVSSLADRSAPGGPGFSVRAIDHANLPLADAALTRTRSLIVHVRSAAHARFGSSTDSVRINVGPH